LMISQYTHTVLSVNKVL